MKKEIPQYELDMVEWIKVMDTKGVKKKLQTVHGINFSPKKINNILMKMRRKGFELPERKRGKPTTKKIVRRGRPKMVKPIPTISNLGSAEDFIKSTLNIDLNEKSVKLVKNGDGLFTITFDQSMLTKILEVLF